MAEKQNKIKEKSLFELLLEICPSESRDSFKAAFFRHKDIQNEDDPLFIIALVMEIFRNRQEHIYNENQKSIDQLKEQINFQSQNLRKVSKKMTILTSMSIAVALFLFLFLSYIFLFPSEPAKQPPQITEVDGSAMISIVELNKMLKAKIKEIQE